MFSSFLILALALLCSACACRINLDEDLCEEQPVLRDEKPERPSPNDRHSKF
jgi:hypothetical protein